MWMALWAAAAWAGTIRVHSASPVTLRVDGQVVGRLKNDYVVTDLTVGFHKVEVLDTFGGILGSSDIHVQGEDPLWFDFYANRLIPVERQLVPTGATPISDVGLQVISIKLTKKPNDEKRLKWFGKTVNRYWYEMRQVDSLLLAFETIAGRVQVAEMLAPRTVDPEKTRAIESHFPPGEDRTRVIGAFAAFWREEEDE